MIKSLPPKAQINNDNNLTSNKDKNQIKYFVQSDFAHSFIIVNYTNFE